MAWTETSKLMDLGQFAMMCVGTTRTRSPLRHGGAELPSLSSILIGP
jgi:hypothetical protein